MVTEQIRQQMTARRAEIDRKIDLLAARATETGRKVIPVSVAMIAVAVVAWSVRNYRSRRRVHAAARRRPQQIPLFSRRIVS